MQARILLFLCLGGLGCTEDHTDDKADAGRDQNDRCRIKFGLEQIHGIFLLYILPVQAREDP